MWTQHWPLAELRDIDRQTRKIICENGGRHPLGSIAVLYLPREKGGRGLRAIEQEYKLIKIKAAVKLYESLDPKMKSVQQFEECAIVKGFSSLITDSRNFAQELDTTLNLNTTEPSCSPTEEPEIATKDMHTTWIISPLPIICLPSPTGFKPKLKMKLCVGFLLF